MNNEPVAWLLFRDGGETYPEYTTSYKQMREWESYLGDNERIEPHYTTLQIKELSDRELVVFLMDEIDRASEWLVDGETHMAIGVLGQCHAKIRKHLSNTKES